ncbi:helix-turn-helix domain-containing protein [Salinarimonas soli]|uniref:Helix-turn-helix domain-containing protein n=1 Tax=Salinarimonas soli TaxID=1638099 RepID=A0A5B2VAK3_9HYPH|nr:XRE family transcriptional regulator [Salinarimonas soli]KAA2236041.1 helix-turn-helix domain-containing protein [Salinarimonas soli]
MDQTDGMTLARRIKAARGARGWTLEALAEASGVSRAMISKIERGEASPTAAVLVRLAGGLGVTLASLFADEGADGSPLARAADQPVWTDPATGYRRRTVSPTGARGAAEITDVTVPAGGRVVLDNAVGWRGLGQQVWVLAGSIEMSVGPQTTRLDPGDCLFMRVDQPLVFHNPGSEPARYAVVLSRLEP